MSEKYDPLKKPDIPLTIVREHFGPKSDARKAARLMRDQPLLYAQMKRIAIKHELLAETKSLSQQHAERYAPKTPSGSDQKVMARYDKATCEHYYKAPTTGAKDTASNLPPEERAILRQAAVAWGVIPEGSSFVDNSHSGQLKQSREKEAPRKTGIVTLEEGDVHRFRLNDDLAAAANLEKGTFVSMTDFSRICQELGKQAKQQAAHSAPAAAVPPEPKPAIDTEKKSDKQENN